MRFLHPLRLHGALCAALLLAACGPAPVPTAAAGSAPAQEVSAPSAQPAQTEPVQTEPAQQLFLPQVLTPPPPVVAEYGYTVINRYPHDPAAFTQGLVYLDGVFYEGTGMRGASSLRRVEVETGNVLQRHNLAAQYFGEGIAVVGEQIYQLTWQEGVAFLYDRATFEEEGRFSYTGEGWGLAYDGERLIMSDGSATLTFRDPATFAPLGTIQVHDEYGPVLRLNELEYIAGEVYANIWQTNFVVRIDPETGRVTGRIDLAGLLSAEERQSADVLNGIAYDAGGDRLFVTGKWWPALFEIRLQPR